MVVGGGSTTQQAILLTLVDATASERHHLRHSVEDFHFFLSLFRVCSTKKNSICGITSGLQWWHIVEAQVSGMQAKGYNLKTINQCSDGVDRRRNK